MPRRRIARTAVVGGAGVLQPEFRIEAGVTGPREQILAAQIDPKCFDPTVFPQGEAVTQGQVIQSEKTGVFDMRVIKSVGAF